MAEESLDDLLLQLEKSSSDLKKQPPSAGNNTRTYTTSSKNVYRDADAQPVEVSSTRWTTTTATRQQNGNDLRSSASPTPHKADVVDQARRLPQNGYSSVNKVSSRTSRTADAAAEREPVIYPHNPVVPVIASYREQHRNSPASYAGAEREFPPTSHRQTNGGPGERGVDRYGDSRNAVPSPARGMRSPATSTSTGAPSNATRALDELMQSFGSLHATSPAATRERRSTSTTSAEGSRTVPRPYNALSETKLEHAESEAELSDMRGKSPTPPRDRSRMSPTQQQQQRSSSQSSNRPYSREGQYATYQPTERKGKGASVNYQDIRNQSSPDKWPASRDRDAVLSGTAENTHHTPFQNTSGPSSRQAEYAYQPIEHSGKGTPVAYNGPVHEMSPILGAERAVAINRATTPERNTPVTRDNYSSIQSKSGPYSREAEYTYQPIERSGKGTSVMYNDSRYQTSPSERAGTIKNGVLDHDTPVKLNSSSSSRLSRQRPLTDTYNAQEPRVASYERLAMTTTRTSTPDDDDYDRRTGTKPVGGVRVLPSSQAQPTSILKRSPTPSRETVNRRIAGVNTENTTAFGDVGRPRSITLSDNEGDDKEYESVREYKYERRETTTTTETQQDEIDASDQRRRDSSNLEQKPTPRARTNRPSQAEVLRSSTTRTVTTTTNREQDDVTPSPSSSMLQPASILRSSGGNTGSKTCSECGKPAATTYDGTPDPENPFVTALGRLWHMQCFACNKCGTVLNNVPFYERQQKLWCEHDYLHHFSPKCAQCAEPIIGQCVTALGSQQFHPNCFQCNHCKKPLLGTGGSGAGGYAEDEGTALCNVCYDERYGKKCRGCGSTIRGGTSYVESLGAAWHDECFRCHMCNDPINRAAGGAAALHELDGKPVCERDYYGRFNATCAACGQPILGRCITAMGKKFHPDHFCCAYCKRELNRGLFKELEGVPWCHPCWAKVFINEEQVVIEQRATPAMPLAPLAALNRNSPARF